MFGPQYFAALFILATNERHKRQAGRLRGKYCVARLLRAQAKRRKAGRTVFAP